MTAAQYDAVRRTAGPRSEHTAEILLGHVALVTDEGLRVVDVHTSRHALEAYLPVIVPATKAAGFPAPRPG
ncbi:hypothetical protein ACFFKE_29560 [Streptomyces mutabilis]|uniref:hypothetical protein n=1 Tax=Streptomyces mutabilis TaxID=67332 RepID=UPI00177BA6AE|nr:hypothetical protein [Streptomyces mutabilis]GGQ22627.1 hypothetical protein GCM10010279_33270 [Streptomyces mutabilis]